MSTSDRVLAILELYSVERPDWSVDEATAVLGLATSTAYRYFGSLTANGMLAPLGAGRYILGPTILQYDRLLRLTDPLILAARSEMERVADIAPRESVAFLCRLFGERVICVHQSAIGAPSFAVGYERGRLMPLLAGSASKAILAHLPPRQIQSLFKRDGAAFTRAGLGASWPDVRAGLATLRAAGVIVTNGEIDVGMRGISVPLFDGAGVVIASLSVAGPRDLLRGPRAATISEQLRRSAGLIDANFARAVASRF